MHTADCVELLNIKKQKGCSGRWNAYGNGWAVKSIVTEGEEDTGEEGRARRIEKVHGTQSLSHGLLLKGYSKSEMERLQDSYEASHTCYKA